MLQLGPPPTARLILTLHSFLPSFLLPALSRILPHRLLTPRGKAVHRLSPGLLDAGRERSWQDPPVPTVPCIPRHQPQAMREAVPQGGEERTLPPMG